MFHQEIARVTQLREDYCQQFMVELNDARKKLEDAIATHKLLKKKYEVLKDDTEKVKQLTETLNAEVDQYELESDAVGKLFLTSLFKLTTQFLGNEITSENTGRTSRRKHTSGAAEIRFI